MPLVDYGSSDESSGEEELMESSADKPRNKLAVSTTSSSCLKSSDPVTQGTSSSSFQRITSLYSTGKVQILAPSFENLDSSSEDEEETGPKFRRVTSSSTGSGLMSLLPPVRGSSGLITTGLSITKSSSSTSTASSSKSAASNDGIKNKLLGSTPTSMVPHSLKRPASTVTSNTRITKKPLLTTESEDVVDPRSFFSLEAEEEPQAVQVEGHVRMPSQIEIAPRVGVYEVPVLHAMQAEQSSLQPDMSDSQFKKKIAAKFGDEGMADNIELIDVDINEHLGSGVNIEFLKTISQERQEHTTDQDHQPNSTVKRKHHITYLAHQAKARELSLKEEWARNKATRDQSKAKYGFK